MLYYELFSFFEVGNTAELCMPCVGSATEESLFLKGEEKVACK